MSVCLTVCLSVSTQTSRSLLKLFRINTLQITLNKPDWADLSNSCYTNSRQNFVILLDITIEFTTSDKLESNQMLIKFNLNRVNLTDR